MDRPEKPVASYPDVLQVAPTLGGPKLLRERSSRSLILIYASEHYATAILEKLVHAGRTQLPGGHHAAAIEIPDDVSTELFDPDAVPGWEAEDSAAARAFGDGWHAAQRSAVLVVPSLPGQPVERNFIINPAHPESARISVLPSFDVVGDGRLFGPSATRR